MARGGRASAAAALQPMDPKDEALRRQKLEALRDATAQFKSAAAAEGQSAKALMAQADVTRANAKMVRGKAAKIAQTTGPEVQVVQTPDGGSLERHPDGVHVKRSGAAAVVLLPDAAVQLVGAPDAAGEYGETTVQYGDRGAGEQVHFLRDAPVGVSWSAERGGRVGWCADGVALVQLPNETHVQLEEGRTVVRPAQGPMAGATIGLLPKDEVMVQFPDGDKAHLGADGVLAVQTADGHVSELYPDGRMMHKVKLSEAVQQAGGLLKEVEAPPPPKRTGGGFVAPPKPRPKRERKVSASSHPDFMAEAAKERARLQALQKEVEARVADARKAQAAAVRQRQRAEPLKRRALTARGAAHRALTSGEKPAQSGKTEDGGHVDLLADGTKVQRRQQNGREVALVVLPDGLVCQFSDPNREAELGYDRSLVQFEGADGQIIWERTDEGEPMVGWATEAGDNVQFREGDRLVLVKLPALVVQFETVPQVSPPLQRVTVIAGPEAVQLLADASDGYGLVSFADDRRVQIEGDGSVVEQRPDGGASKLDASGDLVVKRADGSMWRLQGQDLYLSSGDSFTSKALGQARGLDSLLNA